MNIDGNFPSYEQQQKILEKISSSELGIPFSVVSNFDFTTTKTLIYEVTGSGTLHSCIAYSATGILPFLEIELDGDVVHKTQNSGSFLTGLFVHEVLTGQDTSGGGANSIQPLGSARTIARAKGYPTTDGSQSSVIIPYPLFFKNSLKIYLDGGGGASSAPVSIRGGII